MLKFAIFICKKNVSPQNYFTQKRFRFKEKWASSKAKKTPTVLALEHFDNYLKPVFGKQWPSIRIALLSQRKHCAVLNNFCDNQTDSILELASQGAYDFLKHPRESLDTESSKSYSLLKDSQSPKDKILNSDYQGNCSSNDSTPISENDISPGFHDFMPVNRILSENEKMSLKEHEQSVYQSKGIDIQILPQLELNLPHELKVMTNARSDICIYPPAKRDKSSGKLTYYLMDAASILPVLALDLVPGCSVLDLCAAPGGKSFAMLQTKLPGSMTCVDHSYNRVQRLKEVMKLYFPRDFVDEKRLSIVHSDGVQFCHRSDVKYDRVLVDVPCYADRHVLAEDDNNIFRPSRMSDRLQIQELQQQLLLGGISIAAEEVSKFQHLFPNPQLVDARKGSQSPKICLITMDRHFVKTVNSGIQLCNPGGTIVYSTCTLSPPQNDGVVQATLEKIWQETKLDIAVEDTGLIADKFQNTFNFFHNCRYGQLVLPNLTANFGPTYFCKLKRLN